MKTNELKMKLVQNGVESEKKAKSIITWHEALAFLSTIVIFNVLSALFNIDWGLMTLIFAIISVFLSKRYIEKNLSNIEKINKTYKISKMVTIIMMITMLILLLLFIVFTVRNYKAQKGYEYKENNYSDNLGIYKDVDVEGIKLVLSSGNMNAETIKEVKRVLGQRIEEFYSEQYEIRVENSSDNKQSIIIKVPKQTEVDELSKLLVKEGKLKFVEGTMVTDDEGNISVEPSNVVMEGKDIVSARSQLSSVSDDDIGKKSYFIELTISDEAVVKFAKATERAKGNVIFILLDDEILMAPMVNERIETKNPIITGDYTEKEAKEIEKMINIGHLPEILQIETAEYLENINEE